MRLYEPWAHSYFFLIDPISWGKSCLNFILQQKVRFSCWEAPSPAWPTFCFCQPATSPRHNSLCIYTVKCALPRNQKICPPVLIASDMKVRRENISAFKQYLSFTRQNFALIIMLYFLEIILKKYLWCVQIKYFLKIYHYRTVCCPYFLIIEVASSYFISFHFIFFLFYL